MRTINRCTIRLNNSKTHIGYSFSILVNFAGVFRFEARLIVRCRCRSRFGWSSRSISFVRCIQHSVIQSINVRGRIACKFLTNCPVNCRAHKRPPMAETLDATGRRSFHLEHIVFAFGYINSCGKTELVSLEVSHVFDLSLSLSLRKYFITIS